MKKIAPRNVEQNSFFHSFPPIKQSRNILHIKTNLWFIHKEKKNRCVQNRLFSGLKISIGAFLCSLFLLNRIECGFSNDPL